MRGWDIGDWVIVQVPATESTQATDIWEGEVEAIADAPLGGLTLTIRREDSTLGDFHDSFCVHARRPQRGL